MASMEMQVAPEAHAARQPDRTVVPGGGPMQAFKSSDHDPVVGTSIDGVREEIDEAYEDMKTFHNREPDEVFRLVSGHSARLSELRGRIQRVEVLQRQWERVRTREIEPALEELMKQYQIASRQLTVRELDWKMETGAR